MVRRRELQFKLEFQQWFKCVDKKPALASGAATLAIKQLVLGWSCQLPSKFSTGH